MKQGKMQWASDWEWAENWFAKRWVANDDEFMQQNKQKTDELPFSLFFELRYTWLYETQLNKTKNTTSSIALEHCFPWPLYNHQLFFFLNLQGLIYIQLLHYPQKCADVITWVKLQILLLYLRGQRTPSGCMLYLNCKDLKVKPEAQSFNSRSHFLIRKFKVCVVGEVLLQHWCIQLMVKGLVNPIYNHSR